VGLEGKADYNPLTFANTVDGKPVAMRLEQKAYAGSVIDPRRGDRSGSQAERTVTYPLGMADGRLWP